MVRFFPNEVGELWVSEADLKNDLWFFKQEMILLLEERKHSVRKTLHALEEKDDAVRTAAEYSGYKSGVQDFLLLFDTRFGNLIKDKDTSHNVDLGFEIK